MLIICYLTIQMASDILNFAFFSDAPICASVQPTVLGVAANEHLEIACDVKANPNDLKFHWTFNNRTRNMNYND